MLRERQSFLDRGFGYCIRKKISFGDSCTLFAKAVLEIFIVSMKMVEILGIIICFLRQCPVRSTKFNHQVCSEV